MKRSHITAVLVLALLAIVAVNGQDLLRKRTGDTGVVPKLDAVAGTARGSTIPGGGGDRPGTANARKPGTGSGAPGQLGSGQSGQALPAARPRGDEYPRSGPQRQVGESASSRDPVERLIDSYWAASGAEAQVEALRELYRFPQTRVLAVLRPSLDAREAGTREGALVLMRELGVSDPETLAGVRTAAYNDPSPRVQRAALEVLVRYDEGPETRALLEGLAADPAAAHRDLAIRELKRMDREAAARGRPELQLKQIEQNR